MNQINLKSSLSHPTFLKELDKITFFTLALFMMMPFHSQAQHSSNICAHAALAEKIYLQMDGKVYTTDKTVWFKAIAVSAMDHIPTPLSGVL